MNNLTDFETLRLWAVQAQGSTGLQ